MTGFAADYIQVNERLAAFRERYPEGSLQSEIIEYTEKRVLIRAYAYRTPEDARPGIGHSALEIPGKTTFTRGSEIENAETSAWGRALAALGFEVKRAVATAEEVESKVEEPPPVRPVIVPRVTTQGPPPAEFVFSAPSDPLPMNLQVLPRTEPVEPQEEAPPPVAEFGTPPPASAVIGAMCPKHPGERWKGKPGDLYHAKAEGGYCRPAGQPRKGAQK